MKKWFLLGLLALMVMGCDTVRLPFETVDDDNVALEPGEPGEIEILIPSLMIGGENMAPAASSRVYIESNLFLGAEYPEKTVKYQIDGTSMIITVQTALPGWLRVYRDPGGTIYDVQIKMPQDVTYTRLMYVDANGAFPVEFTPEGEIKQQGTICLKRVDFKLQTYETAGKVIYIPSGGNGMGAQAMSFNAQTTFVQPKEWNATTYFPPGTGQTFLFVPYSGTRAIYPSDLYVNGVLAVYLVAEDGRYHFEGKILSNGTFQNGGRDNRHISIRIP